MKKVELYNIISLILGFYKTLLFNLKYFGIKDGIKLPVFISHKVWIKNLKGEVFIRTDHIKTGMIRIGFGETPIFDRKKLRSIWDNNGIVIFKGEARLGHGSKISVKGKLELGNNFILTAESSIFCFKHIDIGNDVMISWENLIMDSDIHKIISQNKIVNEDKCIKIGDHVWIGCRCTILKGSMVYKNNVVAANSGIYSEFNVENSIIGGNPAKVIKKNIEWES